MSSNNNNRSGSCNRSDLQSKHRKLVIAALASNALALLSMYQEKGIDIFCCAEMYRSDKSIVSAAILNRIEAIRTLCELGADINTLEKEWLHCCSCSGWSRSHRSHSYAL